MKSNHNLLRRFSSITFKLLGNGDGNGELNDVDKWLCEENMKYFLLCCLLKVWSKYRMGPRIFKN